MNGIRFNTGARLLLKKPHPCGGQEFAVLRSGSDVHLRCLGCGRDLTIPRLKLEKNIRKIIDPIKCVSSEDEYDLDNQMKGIDHESHTEDET